MNSMHVFGYGSLVNRATHSHAPAHRAKAEGWRRVWRHTPLRPVAFLTVVPDPACTIDGLIAQVPAQDWAALDLREAAYERVAVQTLRHDGAMPAAAQIYTIPEGRHGAPDAVHPVLLSYLDVVVKGFATEFGEAGVARFFETTDGWDAPIVDDRATPIYARHQSLGARDLAMVDAALRDLSAVVQHLEQSRLAGKGV